MELLKLNSTMLKAINAHISAKKTTLMECYSTWSNEKVNAFKRCRELFLQYAGENFKIISHNRNEFTVGFVGMYENKKAFFYITKNHNRVCYI